MNEKQSIRPSGWYYLLGIVVIFAGASRFVYALFHGLFHLTDHLTQVVVPGEKDLTLQAKLRYTIFPEEQSVVDGRIYSTRTNLNGLTCHVTDLTSGKKIDTPRAAMSTTYNVGERSGRSVLEFVTEEAGTYHLNRGYEEAGQGPEVVLAVGSGVTEGILGMILKCLAAMFGGGIVGGGILVTVYSLRERAKKRLRPVPFGPT
jgi:hypothetical protein